MTGSQVRLTALIAAVVLIGGCRSISRAFGGDEPPPEPPPELTQAHAMFDSLSQVQLVADAQVQMIRAEPRLDTADAAVARRASPEFVDAISHLALREVQMADLTQQLAILQRTTDSLRTERLQKLLTMSEAERQALQRQQALSQQEIQVLQQQRSAAQQEADSLRRVAEEAHARLNQALEQLRGLIVEITNIRETQRGLVISLSDILFDVDRATLKPGAEANIRRISTVLEQYPDYRISVEGHTDATGPDAYNQQLSEQRAQAVRTALVAGGVDPSRITAVGYGEAQPIASNDQAAGRQQNRRVEVVVLGAGKVADAFPDTGTVTRPDSVRIPPRD